MTPRDLRNIHTTGNSCKDTLLCTGMALKLLWYFHLLMGKPLGCYFQIWSPYYQVAQCNEKTLIPVSSKWQVRSEKAKKRISINTNHSYHQHSSPQTSLNWSNNQARFSFNQPNRKRCGAKLVDVKHLPHKVTQTLEGLPTKAKEASSPHEVRLALLDTNIAFQCLRKFSGNYRLLQTSLCKTTHFFNIQKMRKFIHMFIITYP